VKSSIRTGLLILGSNLVVLGLIGGILVLDKAQLHWYSAPPLEAATPTREVPAVDRVVAVTRVCEPADGDRQKLELFGGCEAVHDLMKVNDHLEVTVRTSTGGSYTVSVPATTTVRIGQEWP
jgi:hypothetical protein